MLLVTSLYCSTIQVVAKHIIVNSWLKLLISGGTVQGLVHKADVIESDGEKSSE